MVYGDGSYQYELVKDWGKFPAEWNLSSVPGVYVDGDDHVILLCRSDPKIIVMDTDGNVLDTWGDDLLVRPHGMYIDPETRRTYVVDGEVHVVYVLDENRNIIMTLGEKGVKSETGANNKDFRTVKKSAGPFNFPTNIAIASDGSMYVTDGYGNARVHKFSSNGTYEFSFGEPGTGEGEFYLPHHIYINADDVLYVCDRHNNRIQLFTKEGKFMEQWTDFKKPAQICKGPDGLLYIGECKQTLTFDDAPSRVSICTEDGKLVSRLWNPESLDTVDQTSIMPDEKYRCVHGISVDSEGSIYTAEVGQHHDADYIAVRKYRRVK